MENQNKKINWKLLLKKVLVFVVIFCVIFAIMFGIGSCMVAKAATPSSELDSSLPGFAIYWYPVNELSNYFEEGSEVWFDAPLMQFQNSILVLYNGTTVVYAEYQDTSHASNQFYFYSNGFESTYIGFLMPLTSSMDVLESHYYLENQSDTISSNFIYSEGYSAGLAVGGSSDSTHSYELGYSTGHGIGYSEGYSKAESDLNASIESRLEQARAEGFAQGETAQASSDHVGIKYIWAIASVPISTLATALNWDFLGINLFSLVTGVLTILLIVWVIKKVN